MQVRVLPSGDHDGRLSCGGASQGLTSGKLAIPTHGRKDARLYPCAPSPQKGRDARFAGNTVIGLILSKGA